MAFDFFFCCWLFSCIRIIIVWQTLMNVVRMDRCVGMAPVLTPGAAIGVSVPTVMS